MVGWLDYLSSQLGVAIGSSMVLPLLIPIALHRHRLLAVIGGGVAMIAIPLTLLLAGLLGPTTPDIIAQLIIGFLFGASVGAAANAAARFWQRGNDTSR